MNASELALNIAVNLGRIARYAISENDERRLQFIAETNGFIDQLDKADKKPDFIDTWNDFKVRFFNWANTKTYSDQTVEDLYTWANILTHRAKLA